MIQAETITIRGRQLTRTYSDAGRYIERDGARYAEAVDPVGSGRTYTETDEPIPVDTSLEARVGALEENQQTINEAMEKGLSL